MKIKRIICILHSRDKRYWGFTLTDCKTGKTVSGYTTGGECNVRTALTHDGEGWVYDYFLVRLQWKEKELFALPFVGCHPDDIRRWVKNEFKKS